MLGRHLVLLGDAGAAPPLISLNDAAELIVRAGSVSTLEPGTVLHAVGGQTTTARALAARLARDHGLRVRRIPAPVLRAGAAVAAALAHALGRDSPITPYRVRAATARLRFDCTRTRMALGWPEDADGSDLDGRLRRWRDGRARPMELQDEITRVRRVYRGYAERGRGAREWAADHPGNRAMVDERTRVLAALLERSGRLPLGSRRVLDLGCGDGDVLAGLVRWGALPARLTGVDVRAEAVARAHARWPDLRFEVADATVLPHRDASFDLVLCFTLFTSILDDGVARQVAGEIRRVLRPGGGLVWYDFRVGNPWNPHVRGMSRRHLRELFPEWRGTLRLVTLLPPLARRLHALTPVLYPVLAAVPPLRTHWAGLLECPK